MPMNKNYGLLIDGKWVKNKKTFSVFNPFDGKIISVVSSADSNNINDSIKFAHLAFQKWSKTSAKVRSDILKKLFIITKENKDILSEIITLSQVNPLKNQKLKLNMVHRLLNGQPNKL